MCANKIGIKGDDKLSIEYEQRKLEILSIRLKIEINLI